MTESESSNSFLPSDFTWKEWTDLKPFFDDLQHRELLDLPALKNWLIDQSELSENISEKIGWAYIAFNRNTKDAEAKDNYTFLIREVIPHVTVAANQLNKRFVDHPDFDKLGDDYRNMKLEAQAEQKLFREENVPLKTELSELESQFGSIAGGMSVTIDGEELTIQQANAILKQNDRKKRERVFRSIAEEKVAHRKQLNDLFDQLIDLRSRIAKNAGFDNYRDYRFAELGRFDYTPEDCFEFHRVIKKEIVPLTQKFDEERKKLLQIDSLRPWDMSVDPFGRDPIQLFDGSQKDLIEKTTRVLRSVDPFFSDSLLKMEKMEHLDLESRRGKAPGGFNYPLYKTGVPFVFMNAVGVLRDFVVLIHESGHAVHSIVTHDLPLINFKRMPSEVAELASMAMELLTMEHWNEVLGSEELVRAKKEQLSKIIDLLPWISLIDEFQHWIYTTPHTADEREKKWMELSDEYSCHTVDWSGFEDYQHIKWQGQLHLYEVPFYYIEYAMAQLGAIGVWMNYKENPEHALRQYLSGLKLGYTKSIPEIYETAGVSFDFSSKHIQQLAHAVLEEYHKLN